MGGAAPFPAHDGLQVVHVLDDPYQGFRFHEVERNPAVDVLPLGHDALGDIPDDGSLDQAGLGAVPVQALLGQVEVAGVLRQGRLLVEGHQPVLQGALDGCLPRPG